MEIVLGLCFTLLALLHLDIAKTKAKGIVCLQQELKMHDLVLSFSSGLKNSCWNLALFAFIHWSTVWLHLVSHLRYCSICELVFWGFPNDFLISCYYYTAHSFSSAQPCWFRHLSHLSCEIVMVALVAALHFFSSLFVAWTSLGVWFPWPPTSQQHWHVGTCCITALLGVFLIAFVIFCFPLFFRIPWSITSPHESVDRSLALCFLQVPFQIACFSRGSVKQSNYRTLACPFLLSW